MTASPSIGSGGGAEGAIGRAADADDSRQMALASPQFPSTRSPPAWALPFLLSTVSQIARATFERRGARRHTALSSRQITSRKFSAAASRFSTLDWPLDRPEVSVQTMLRVHWATLPCKRRPRTSMRVSRCSNEPPLCNRRLRIRRWSEPVFPAADRHEKRGYHEQRDRGR